MVRSGKDKDTLLPNLLIELWASFMMFSAVGFLLVWREFPNSKVIPSFFQIESCSWDSDRSFWKMLAPSVLMQELDDTNWPIRDKIEFPTFELVSYSRMFAKQKPVNFSTTKRMCWLFLTMMSAENLDPKSSETVVVSENRVEGKGFSDRQTWHESTTSVMTLVDPGQRKYLDKSLVIWYFEGWTNLMWIAETRPGKRDWGTTIGW